MRAHGRVLQALDEFLVAAIVRPRRNDGGKRIRARGVCVGVGGHVDTRTAGVLDALHDLRHAAPVGLSGGLQMPDLDRDFRFAPDAERLVERGCDGVAFIANVGSIDAAGLCRLRRQRDQFFGLGVRCGRILQRGGNSNRAVAHGVADQRLHALQFGGAGVAIVVPQHHAAHLGSADITGEIDPHSLLAQAREVLAERAPVR
jgi:hypothetical protein